MRSGELRHRIQLQRPVETQSPTTGEVTTSWTAVATVWARVSPVSANKAAEAVIADKPTVIREAVVKLRYRADIDTTWRVQHGVDLYNIKAIQDVEMLHQELRMACVEVR